VTKDVDEINHAFTKLSKGGKVTMELQETFWSPRYGMLTDKFGIDWQFSLQA
jgi:PhnB protein